VILEAMADQDLWIWHAFFGMEGTHSDILEAVADQDLWIWHAFFGMAGTHNAIGSGGTSS
jgi:hypothetical protein